MALRESLRGIALYTALLALAVALSRVVAGVNVVANAAVAIITYLVGFAIMSLVGSFHTTASLADAARAKAEHTRKTQELEEARALQLSMLPATAPDVPGFVLAFGMRTATEVGGDYYDWRIGADGELKLAVGDATGHGVRAGLVVVSAKTLFQTGGAGGALDVEMRRVSDGVRSLHLPRMNMALALATLAPGRARISAGGMPPVLHYRVADGSVFEIPMHAPPRVSSRAPPIAKRASLLRWAIGLLFFTDGLPELQSETGDLFGYDRVRDTFLRAAPAGAQPTVDALFAAADALRGARPPDDDVTLVVVAVGLAPLLP